jgi:hypothetical protein
MKKALYFRLIKVWLVSIPVCFYFYWTDESELDFLFVFIASYFVFLNFVYFLIFRFAKKGMAKMERYYAKYGKLPSMGKKGRQELAREAD